MQHVTENNTHQHYIHSEGLALELGVFLPSLKIEYSTYGTFDPSKNNVVWICHALTANADPVNWWPGLVGEGFLYSAENYFIVCANIVGSCYGSSGPLEINSETGKPYFNDFPKVTIRDMVKAHEVLRAKLGISSIHTCIGGSLGGQQALEWSISNPTLIDNLIVMATNAVHSPWGIAFNESQRMAIKADPTWQDHSADAGKTGMAAARAMALLSYRTYETYKQTQSEEDGEKVEGFKAVSYQQYQGEKLKKRFNCHSYILLTEAMDCHNVGRGRGGVDKALSLVASKTLLIGIGNDVLFPPCEQQFIQARIKHAQYKELNSLYGHDGFLIETNEIAEVIKSFYSAS